MSAETIGSEFSLLADAIPQIVWMTRPDGSNFYFNQQWVDYTGLTLEESSGAGWNKPFHPDDRQRAWDAWKDATGGRGTYSLECRLRRADGVYKWWLIRGNPVLDAQGTVLNWIGTCTDIEQIKSTGAALRTSEEHYRILVNSLTDQAIILLDADGYIISWNSYAETIRGYTAKELVGRHFSQFFPLEDIAAEKPAMELRQAAETGRFEEENWRIRRDGSKFWARVVISPVYDQNQKLRGFVKVTHDLTKLREAELAARANAHLQAQQEVARQALAAAEAANQAKSEFLSCMSHEIRTPLGIILGYAELLRNDIDGTLDVKKVAELISKNGIHLMELINDILDLSKVEAGAVALLPTPIEVQPFLAKIAENFANQSIKKGLTFSVELTGRIPSKICSDELRLTQVLTNLVGNAIKFTDRGYVRVNVSYAHREASNGILVFNVSDSGCGIAPEYHNVIFEPFTQADKFVVRKYGGTGLGLGLARNIARELGGNVTLKFSAPQQGSMFEFTLNPGELKDSGWISAEDMPGAKAQPRQAGHATAGSIVSGAEQPLQGAKLLLVDDFEDNRNLIRLILQRLGAAVDTSVDGADGVKKALNGDYDLVLMDIQMPVMNGYEATTILRHEGYGQPIIALTAHAMDGERERCVAAGCNGYLSKPINKGLLIATLTQHLGPAETRRSD